MFIIESEINIPSPITSTKLWFPGRTGKGFSVQPLSERAQEIAKKQEELIRLLRDLPESDYELSLTGLVENDSVDVSVDEGKKKVSKKAVKPKKKISRSSSTDGVLLNMFVPLSMTRRLNGSKRSPIDRTKRYWFLLD
ncbi:hypothetical protein QJS10_CPB15g00796 [Acorus calamus]|uniref:Uncharacterized protein n=1 Tax=Acorus calamus TaxID=4465 RepID=A0AAV9D3K8_ACOCL|nr:hypothetical protein QJS10_CPB15g00796 [Acorus calamus]